MRFVPAKCIQQQDIQSIHRIRSLLVSRQTAQANQIREWLLEYGVVIPKGIAYIRARIPEILEDAENGLTPLFRQLLNALYEEMVHLDQRIGTLEQKLQAICLQSKDCQRLFTIPGIGLLTAIAMVAAVSDIPAFKNGRELAVWMGLVPRQQSTGKVTTLMGISKRGDSYLRTLLIHGARAVIRIADKYQDKRNRWISKLEQRRGKNISAVGVANKNVRIAWALLSKKENYDGVAA